MNVNRHGITALACVAALAGTVVATAKEDKPPKKQARLAVTINQVGPKTPVNQPVRLRSRVSWSGGPATFSYWWDSASGPPLPDGVDYTDKELTLPVGTLEPGRAYHIRLRVTATTPDDPGEDGEKGLTIQATNDVKFTANEPPSGGSCTLHTKAVSTNVVRVDVAAPGWTDPDGQVQYRFEVRRGTRMLAVQNWRLFSTFTTTVRFDPGDVVYGRCAIRDKYGDGDTYETRKITLPEP